MEKKRTAAVYRGPAAPGDCPTIVADALEKTYKILFVGPEDHDPIDAIESGMIDVWLQPGGGDDVDEGWDAIKPFHRQLRKWVMDGGRYVGICMGAFLAGTEPGLGLLPKAGADSIVYIETDGADVTDLDEALITVTWRGKQRDIYYQGGPAFELEEDAEEEAEIVATYSNDEIAALIVPCGRGAVGVIGPHPEAPQAWYDECKFEADAGENMALFRRFVDDTIAFGNEDEA